MDPIDWEIEPSKSYRLGTVDGVFGPQSKLDFTLSWA